MTKILLVEDDKSLREIYGVRLLAEGYDIVSASDGEEALAMAIKEKPTLIISDVMMPKISGFDMLDILRSTTETRDIKVIMMTALSSDDQRARGEQLGADKYLVKSQVGIEDVVRTVHEVLGDTTGGSVAPVAPPVSDASEEPVISAVPAPDNGTPATPPSSDPAPTADETTTPAAAAPGNEEAGPLPPQPTETSLPQPTAPFASPRPATLGERVIQPLDAPAEPVVSAEAIAQELQASAEPVTNSQVDEVISDKDVEAPVAEAGLGTAPSVDPAPAAPVTDTAPPAGSAVNPEPTSTVDSSVPGESDKPTAPTAPAAP